jgi:flagellar biosynthesis/type III secretory pathway protein FliH
LSVSLLHAFAVSREIFPPARTFPVRFPPFPTLSLQEDPADDGRTLPRQETQEFYNDLQKLEQENIMPFITSIEEIGIEKGIAKGLQQGIQQGLELGQATGEARKARQGILEVLSARFGAVPDSLSPSLEPLSDPDHLTQLLRLAATCPSLDAFLHHLLVPTHPAPEQSL